MSTPPPPLLELRNLSKRFGDVVAVAGVSERIGRGEYFCIVGPSGCGKTTLLRLIAGFEEPDTGVVALDGVVLNELPPERRDVNVVFQSYALFPHLSVFDNVAFGLRMKRQPAALVRSRTEEALRLVHLDREPDRYPAQLSGGQQQRVALARALVLNPQILLLDEPLSNLDAKIRVQVRSEIRKLQKELGITAVYVTHDQ
ncbi:MAG: ABC transporter ATP-binding protein, partial [Gemmatimonadetes bacterium]|nr:ABC transporter ATP-binding protein [Gemmatimonadota bacterium]